MNTAAYGKSMPGRGIRLCKGWGVRGPEQQPIWKHRARTVAVRSSRLRGGPRPCRGAGFTLRGTGGPQAGWGWPESPLLVGWGSFWTEMGGGKGLVSLTQTCDPRA